MSDRPEPSYAGDQPFFFVSYGHEDRDLVYPEMRWLQEAGFNLWYDEGIHAAASGARRSPTRWRARQGCCSSRPSRRSSRTIALRS
jgi:hypothetical protein